MYQRNDTSLLTNNVPKLARLYRKCHNTFSNLKKPLITNVLKFIFSANTALRGTTTAVYINLEEPYILGKWNWRLGEKRQSFPLCCINFGKIGVRV